MAASSTLNLESFSNISLISARCTGFVKIHGQNDYNFIIDLEWSDDRNMSIKRSYTEFQSFHSELLKLFPELRHADRMRPSLRTGIKENVVSYFVKDRRNLAESRESLLDTYLVNLLRQPERIRKSNLVLSFFEPRDSDPKPCKSHSPAEKSDSGIDLTSDKSASDKTLQNITVPEDVINQSTTDDNRPMDSDDEQYDGDSSESGTETEEGIFDEDYFLDVGFGELMLHKPEENTLVTPMSPTAVGESSMWCSNLDKFSNMLRTSMSNLSIAEQTTKPMHHLVSLNSIEQSDSETDNFDQSQILDQLSTQIESDHIIENSDTESQITADDTLSDDLKIDDEFIHKPLAKNNLKHYYLSTDGLSTLE